MILVTGATGTVGSEVVRALRAGGMPVRAFVRDPDRARERLGPGVELALGDFADAGSVRAALAGADTLVLSCADDPRRVAWETAAIDAAAAAGVRRIVKLSTVGAAPDSPVAFWRWHGEVERHLVAAGIPAVILRSAFHMSNVLQGAAQIAGEGVLAAPAGEARIAMIDPRDVGAAAAAVLAGQGHDGRIYELTGPEALGFEQVAAELSIATGRTVAFADVPLEVVPAPLGEIFRALRAGAGERVTDAVAELTGSPARDLAGFVRDHFAPAPPAPAGPRRVAIVGAGPAGLTAAKQLLDAGIEPVVLEQGDDIGGQWHAGSPHSAIWPGMRTNTSRTMTAFSDFPPSPCTGMFPRAEDVHEYLRAYAGHFGVADRVRTGARVDEVSRDGEGWTVRWTESGGERTERFAGVVLATGRFRRPRLPAVPGLEALGGRVTHSSAYRGRDAFRRQRVLVYGNSISGLEIASDLAADHTIAVTSACRRPRYVIQKVVRGLPTDWRWFTRFAALLGAALPPDAAAAGMRDAVLAEAGDPARYGGLAVDPAEPPMLAQSQEYLAYVAEGRIAARPEVERVDGGVVHFADGRRTEVDAVICATGYDVDLPYLAADVRAALCAADGELDLHLRTFHPDLPGLAVLGQYLLVGPYLPTVELQARWIAAVWSGAIEAPSPEWMRASIAEHRAARERQPFDLHHALSAALAAELGVEPDPAAWPELAAGLLFGPLAPARYRLQGPGAQPDAERRLGSALADFGPPAPVPAERLDALRMVAEALEDPALAAIADRLGAGEPELSGARAGT